MKSVDDSPVYKLNDRRYSLFLCSHGQGSSYSIYFMNDSSEEIGLLKMYMAEYCYKEDIREEEMCSSFEDRFISIKPGGHILLTDIDVVYDKPGEYILNLTIMTEKERVIAECTLFKEGSFSGSFDSFVQGIGKRGKRLSLESRSFSIV